MSLGPFASSRDALKFLGYVVVGAVVAGLLSAWIWLPFLGLGLIVSLRRADDRPVDERFLSFLAWRFRTRSGSRGNGHGTGSQLSRNAKALELEGGLMVGVVRANGVPVSFLPPKAAQGLFHRYRAVLLRLDRDLAIRMRNVRLPATPFAPGKAPLGSSETAARSGYAEIVRLLVRRRRRREVLVTLSTKADRGSSSDSLDSRLAELANGLGELGIQVERLEGSALLQAFNVTG